MDQKKQLQTVITGLEKIRREIQDGTHIATTDELIFGLPFWRSDPHRDAQRWFEGSIQGKVAAFDATGRLGRQLATFSRDFTASTADAARDTALELKEGSGAANDEPMLDAIATRLDIYAAELGDREAATRVAVECISLATSGEFDVIRRAEALISGEYFARIASTDLLTNGTGPTRSGQQRRHARDRAAKAISIASDDYIAAVSAFEEWALQRATAEVTADANPRAPVDDLGSEKTEPLTAEKVARQGLEDLSFIPRFQPASLRQFADRFQDWRDEFPGITVVGSLGHLPRTSKGDNSIWQQFKSLEGRHIPLVGCTEPAGVYADLVDRYPWAEGAISTLIKEVGRRPTVRLRPTLLVGPPGCGKTRLAMTLATALGLLPTKYACAGVADASFAGTSRQWGSARASVPLQAIQRSMIANPGIILDEIEKTATERRNGSLLDSLLDFLERDNARRVFDPALECPIDLSGVVYIATANSLSGLPAAIADRFRILHIDAPGPEHLIELSNSILDDYAQTEDIDRRWIPDLDGDELAVIRTVWNGGSVRPLKAAIEATLQVREEHSPRM